MVILMSLQQLNLAAVQLTILVHLVKNVPKVMAAHIHWLASIWDNAGHADHYVMNDQINAIAKQANVQYVFYSAIMYA